MMRTSAGANPLSVPTIWFIRSCSGKKLASATTEEALYEVKGELRDQCGEPPAEVDALVEVMSLKNELRALRMRGLKHGPGRLVAQLGPDAALDPPRLAQLVARGKGKYRLTPGAPLQFYVGGGLNVLRPSAGGTSSTDTGWDLFGGLESRRSYIHPYVEARALLHDRSTLQVNAGLNFTLF